MFYKYLIFLICAGCSVSPLHDGGSLKANNIDVDVIAERDGQILRGFVVDSLRDLSFAKEKYRLTISLTYVEKPFAIATDGNAKRVSLSYVANVVLKNHREEVVFTRPVSVHASSNISSAQGEAILSLYGRDNGALLKELGRRILESLKVFLSNES